MATDAATISPLPYADLPARWGVSLHRGADVFQLSIPPVPGASNLGLKFLIPFCLIAALIAALWTFIGPRAFAVGGDEWIPLLVNTGIYGTVLALMSAHAWHRLRERVAFEVNPARLVVTTLCGDRILRQASWPRALVAHAKYNTFCGKLLVRITGRELVEFHVTPIRELAEWAAGQLDEALRTVRIDPAGELNPGKVSHRPVPMKRGWKRTALLTLAGILAGAGVVLFFTPLRPLGVYAFLLAAAPAGLALGTQEKEFYA